MRKNRERQRRPKWTIGIRRRVKDATEESRREIAVGEVVMKWGCEWRLYFQEVLEWVKGQKQTKIEW